MHSTYWAIVLAISSVGCGSLYIEGAPVRVSGHASATLEVDARVEGRAGRLEIVEQAPGQGFVVEGGGAAFLAGFEARSGSSAPVSEASCAGGSCGASVVAIGSDASPSVGSSGAVEVTGASGSSGVAAGSSGSASSGGASCASGTCGSSAAFGSTGSSGGSGSSGVLVGSSGASGSGSGTGSSGVVVGSSGAGGSSGVAIGVDASASIEAEAEVPRDGVWGVDGRATALTAITGPGVQVDGVRVQLSDLEALASLSLPPAPSTELATDGTIEAWAELEHEALPRAGGETHVVVRVRAPAAASVPRGRVRVHLVIDRSSSMQRSWDRVLAAARMLIGRLSPDDELHIVAYGTDAIEAFPIGRVGNGRAAIAALENIAVGGGTNIEAGLELAYRASARAGGDARGLVLLLSDGVPNHGAFEPAELGSLVARARIAGCTTSVIGLGTEFDARLLRAIARQGRGGYHVSARLDALAQGLVTELEAHARVAARHLTVRVALPSDVELVELGEGERVDGGVELSMPHLAAGEERTLLLRVRVPGGRRARVVADVTLRYRSAGSDRVVRADSALDVSFGPRAVVRDEGQAGAGVIDASLASALDAAGAAILDGDSAAATRALELHADSMEGRVEHRRSPALQARVRVVRRLSSAVEALLPQATHPQRRQVALAFGGLAARFAR